MHVMYTVVHANDIVYNARSSETLGKSIDRDVRTSTHHA